MWHVYRQNNSGGSHQGPAAYVAVEVRAGVDHEKIAEAHGVYFDGCEKSLDCECCGDRWDRRAEEQGTFHPIEGLELPRDAWVYRSAIHDQRDCGGVCVLAVFADGRVERYGLREEAAGQGRTDGCYVLARLESQ